MKKIIPLLALVLLCPPLTAQVDYNGTYPWSQTTNVAPDDAVPGWFYNLGITGLRVQLDPNAPRTLVVKHVFVNTPADPAGSTVHFRVGDVITGVEGQAFTADHQDGYGPTVFGAQGPISEFGIALDAAQGTDGILSVTRLRGTTTTTRNLTVGTVYGSFSPTFPSNCPKSTLILSQLLTYLRTTQQANGAWAGEGSHENHIFAGLALLSDGSAASMTAAGNLATYYNNQTNAPIAADGLNNWKYLAAAIYLSEYYQKTNQAWVLTKLNTLYGYLLASQYTHTSQIVFPHHNGVDPSVNGFGGWGHNPGFEGYGPIGMTTGQGALALSLMKRVGVNVDRTRLDAAYDFIVKGTGANNYVWYGDGQGGGPNDWADPGRTGVAAIANWMSPYAEPAYAARALGHARFMGAHPQSFPDTHGSPTIGMAYAAMGTHFDPVSFRQLLDDNLWWFSLAHTPEGNFYYQPNRDNAIYDANPRFVASSVTALILSLPKRNLLISARVLETLPQASFASAPAALSTSAISMTATTATSSNGPIEYLFTETSGNPGGTSSNWQTSTSYTDSGLFAGTQYTYTVATRDALGSAGAPSAPASATTQTGQPLDLMRLNFYNYGGYAAANYNTVTLEAGESAGVSPFNVTGWQNFQVPFGLSSPMAPVTLTSNLGATATFTLNDVRNGWTYSDPPHTNFAGGNGDLMNGHCNGTEDPYDGSNFFDMAVTNISYPVYDLVVYIGSNAAQFGNGTGKIVLNGGAVKDFTLTAGEFAGFVEITNAVTPGNYIIFRGLRNPSLTLRVWGNGFNHIGPAGFQIVKDSSGVIPPGPAAIPNPADASMGHPSNTDLSWTGGLDAVSRNVYFGTNPTPGASELRGNQTATTYDPGTLANGTYYWRIDEVNADGTTAGPVWSFAVGSPAKAFRPMPWDGMSAVATDVGTLKWVAGESVTVSSNAVYFGTDSTPDAGEFKGNQSGTTFNPGLLSAGVTYYWRIDQVNAQGTTTGDVWSFTTPISGANKVKIFIMAGQSNMEGQGEMNPAGTPGTLETIYNNDPVTYAHLKSGGSWAVRNDAWIWYKREGTTLVHGGLTAGYGSSATTIGPELQFGHAMGDYYGQKVLLIKTAWGGKSLRTDFRPPSSGWNLDVPVTAGDEGYYFKQMLEDVVDATADLQTYFPTHNPADGYEIAGFAWHQGWNDRVTPAFAAEYEVNMAKFIRDVRSSVGVPRLPFVIATTGMDGNPDYSEVELAQLQMENFTTYPDFDGNVAAIDTQSFWFSPALSPADQGFHWNRNAGSYYQVGKSIAEEMQTLIGAITVDIDPPVPNPMNFAVPPTSPTSEVDPLSVLSAATLAGNNPATGAPWQPGDSYRLAFVSSATTAATSTDISTYNAFVQGLANTAGHGVATWKVIGSTATVEARDNTGTNPASGAGVAVYLMDGNTLFAAGNSDLWNGANVALNRNQNNIVLNAERIFTGSEANGTRAADSAQVLGGSSGNVQTGRSDIAGNNWMRDFNAAATGPQQVFALSDPIAIGAAGDPFTQITMTASTATDASGVEYYFDETSGNPGGSDSGWQDSPAYTDTGLQPGKTYTYTVTARDKSTNQNITAPSAAMSATTAYTSAFTAWADGPFPSGQTLTDSDPGLDFDGGSLPTGIEWIVGGDPTIGSDDAALTPSIRPDTEPGFHLFTYRLSNAAAADVGTEAFIEYTLNLSSWTKAIHNGDTIRITTIPGGTFATVEVKLKTTLAPEGRLFVRLKATVTP